MSGYTLHPEAFADLDEIWEYIAQHNVDAADRVLADIHSTLTALAASPQIGYRRPDLTTRPLRFHIARHEYLIVYAPDDKPLWVVAVIHGHRNPRLMAASFATESSLDYCPSGSTMRRTGALRSRRAGEAVTHVSRMKCYLCLRNRPNESGVPSGIR